MPTCPDRSRSLLRSLALAVLTGAALSASLDTLLLIGHAWAQEGTPTFTRRPTPPPTSTLTPTSTSTATPTEVPPGTELFLCSAGTNDGVACAQDVQCPEGTCVLTQGVCNGGPNDRDLCGAVADCAGAGCVFTHRVCLAGDREGFPCLANTQCGGGGTCVSTGLFCDGGPFNLTSCVDDADCSVEEEATCRGLDTLLCSAGPSDGELCIGDSECMNGACVIAQKVCDGGSLDGFDCEGDVNCEGGICVPTQRICGGGGAEGFGCVQDGQCPEGLCVSTGLICGGGPLEFFSCFSDEDCTLDGEEPGFCSPPSLSLCTGGPNEGIPCGEHIECPGGACVTAQRVCDGGEDFDGFNCSSHLECDPGIDCVPTQQICGAGEFQSFGCLRSTHCDGSPCLSSGMFCDGGIFESFACTGDSDCQFEGEESGTCQVPTAQMVRCSAGSNDNRACTSNDDCPGGSCVRTQGVCDGGEADSLGCDSNGDCPGAECVPTRLVCDSGDFVGFACLRNTHCAGETSGSCIASGRVCEAGPFDDLSCIDDIDCFLSGEEPGACIGRTPRACSLEAPCDLTEGADGQVFSSSDSALFPAGADYYTSSVPPGAVGTIIALAVGGGDADLYVGTVLSNNIEDYSAFSDGAANDELRFDALSIPTFAELTAGVDRLVVTVIGAFEAPFYRLDVLYLGPSPVGDIDCDLVRTEEDVDGLLRAIFDVAATLSETPFGRCIGGDANADGRESAADITATIQARATEG